MNGAEVVDGSEIDAEEAGDIDPDADPEATATTKHKEYRWVRNPLDERRRLSLTKRTGREQISPGASIEWLVDSLGGRQCGVGVSCEHPYGSPRKAD